MKEVAIKDKNNEAIEPFQTNFAAVEDFCLLIVNYFRDIPR